MIYLAKRLLAQETEADKEEFLRGVVGLNKKAGEKKVILGFVAGTMLGRKKSGKA